MRFLYALIAIIFWILFWILFTSQAQGVSVDTRFLALAIVFAGAMAGGDGK